MGDTLVTLALAGTLFFDVPSEAARENVARYLLITLAPFAVLGPVLGSIYARFPAAYRGGLAMGAATRAGVAILMLVVGLNDIWLYPLAFLLLVFSRFHGISRSSLLPVVVDRPVELVSANARLARIGVIAGGFAVVVGAPMVSFVGPWLALIVASAFFVWSASAALQVPRAPGRQLAVPLGEITDQATTERRKFTLPRSVRLARLATAGVRLLNGFLLLLVAFAFRDEEAGLLDFGALLGAAGAGFLIAAFVSPWLESRLREEPMVVSSLAVEAAAAFIAAQVFGLGAAAALAAAAGFAWGTAKFAYDGLLQWAVSPERRGTAFISSETTFQLVWVMGAIVPVVVTVPIKVGLALAGVAALLWQVVYIAGLLVPLNEQRRAEVSRPTPETPRRDVTDYL